MNEKKLLEQLSLLKSLEPDADFARASRLQILYQGQPKRGRFAVFSQSLSMSVSMGLLIIFFVFAALGGVSRLVRDPLFPTFEGVGSGSLAAEANSVNDSINVRISEVQYLNSTGDKALTNVATPSSSDDEEIDQLLARAKSY